MSDLGTRRPARSRQRGIELCHVHDRLRVRTLPDRKVERLGGTPIPRAVLLVVVIDRVGPVRLILLGEIYAGTVSHRERYSSRDQARKPDLQSELVKVGIARMLDRVLEAKRSVALLLPAAEVAVAELITSRAGHRHVILRRDEPILERNHRRREVERRARRIASLNGFVFQWC